MNVVRFGLGGAAFRLESHYKLELARLPVQTIVLEIPVIDENGTWISTRG